MEESLVRRIAIGLWRLDTIPGAEAGILAGDGDLSCAWLAHDRSLALLSLYESRIRRTIAADKAGSANSKPNAGSASKPKPKPLAFAACNQNLVCSTDSNDPDDSTDPDLTPLSTPPRPHTRLRRRPSRSPQSRPRTHPQSPVAMTAPVTLTHPPSEPRP